MKYRKVIMEVISALFVLLWVYAAVSKLMDFQTFRVQLGKSPLLTDFAGLAAIGIPLVELLIAALLLFSRSKKFGIYASLFLMTLFTTYLIVVLNFSHYIPCSCGGVLGTLDWKAHIIFNLCFILLAIVATLLYNSNDLKRIRSYHNNLHLNN